MFDFCLNTRNHMVQNSNCPPNFLFFDKFFYWSYGAIRLCYKNWISCPCLVFKLARLLFIFEIYNKFLNLLIYLKSSRRSVIYFCSKSEVKLFGFTTTSRMCIVIHADEIICNFLFPLILLVRCSFSLY